MWTVQELGQAREAVFFHGENWVPWSWVASVGLEKNRGLKVVDDHGLFEESGYAALSTTHGDYWARPLLGGESFDKIVNHIRIHRSVESKDVFSADHVLDENRKDELQVYVPPLEHAFSHCRDGMSLIPR